MNKTRIHKQMEKCLKSCRTDLRRRWCFNNAAQDLTRAMRKDNMQEGSREWIRNNLELLEIARKYFSVLIYNSETLSGKLKLLWWKIKFLLGI